MHRSDTNAAGASVRRPPDGVVGRLVVFVAIAVMAAAIATGASSAGAADIASVGDDDSVTVSWSRVTGVSTYQLLWRRPGVVQAGFQVIGGAAADPGSAPYQAGLVVRGGGAYEDRFFCGASIIGPRHALTAAHCVPDTDPASIEVFSGVESLSAITSAHTVRVQRIDVHPAYDTSRPDLEGFADDVALLTLAGDALGTPVALNTDPTWPPAGTDARVTGWGQTVGTDETDRSHIPDALQSAELEVRASPGALCPVWGSWFLPVPMLCANGATVDGMVTTCMGDSGGPLVTGSGSQRRQVGIVSFGPVGCDTYSAPAVYARVSTYASWLAATAEAFPWTSTYVTCVAAQCSASTPPLTDGMWEVRVVRTTGQSQVVVVDADVQIGDPAPATPTPTPSPTPTPTPSPTTPTSEPTSPAPTDALPLCGDGLVAVGSHETVSVRGAGRTDDIATGRPGSATVACGDLDGDGLGDLVVGAPDATVEGRARAGLIDIHWGDGTRTTQHQGRRSTPGQVRAGGRFGTSLAIGDLDADGNDDLVVGAPGGAGEVVVFEGTGTGIRGTDLVVGPHGQSRFGSALAIGDLDADGHDDLAVGAPGATVGSVPQAGTVSVFHGSSRGLRTRAARVWQQGPRGLGDRPQRGDRFGEAVVAADPDGDGRVGLVIGVPGDEVAGRTDAGAVHIVTTLAEGTTSVRWTARELGVTVRPAAEFGAAVTGGDIDGDGADEVVIGAPGTTVAGRASAGAVLVMSSTSARGWAFSLDTPRFAATPRRDARFGASVAVGDVTGDGTPDIVIGAPGERTAQGLGTVRVVIGDPTAIVGAGGLSLPVGNAGERFGHSLG